MKSKLLSLWQSLNKELVRNSNLVSYRPPYYPIQLSRMARYEVRIWNSVVNSRNGRTSQSSCLLKGLFKTSRYLPHYVPTDDLKWRNIYFTMFYIALSTVLLFLSKLFALWSIRCKFFAHLTFTSTPPHL